MFPLPYKYKFYRDAMITVSIMFVVALIGFAITYPYLVDNGWSDSDLIV
jgi:hypothetical protein